MPNPSGFALKLEKFLRMAKIPYEVSPELNLTTSNLYISIIYEVFIIMHCCPNLQIDTTCPKGERQKVPWITLNGENFTDSQLIIEELEK